MRIAHADALALAQTALVQRGAPAQAAAIQADVLVAAELAGRPSHGLLRLPRLLERIDAGVANPASTGHQRWLAPGRLHVDGGFGLGPVVAVEALDAAADRAETIGVVCVSVSAANHLGMLAWYADRLARRSFVCIAVCNSEALVHPFGGRFARIGSNPLAIGIPTGQEDPYVFDMATAATSMGTIIDSRNRGVPLADGVARDAAGDPTTDPTIALTGSISSFGGAKGYGLGVTIDLLVAALSGSALGTDVTGTLDSDSPPTKGDVFLLIHADMVDHASLTDYLDALRSCPPQDGQTVRVPGDRSRAERDRRLRDGFDIPNPVYDQIRLRMTTRLATNPKAVLDGDPSVGVEASSGAGPVGSPTGSQLEGLRR